MEGEEPAEWRGAVDCHEDVGAREESSEARGSETSKSSVGTSDGQQAIRTSRFMSVGSFRERYHVRQLSACCCKDSRHPVGLRQPVIRWITLVAEVISLSIWGMVY